jgi:hypothetical protein
MQSRKLFYGACLLFITTLNACSGDSDMTEQEKYQRDFKVAMCVVMEVHIDRYKKDPYLNNFGIQGYGDRDRVTEMLYERTEDQLKRNFGYGSKNSYISNLRVLPLDEVRENCPEIASKFWQIPF